MNKSEYDDETFKAFVACSKSINELINTMGICKSGRTYKELKARIKRVDGKLGSGLSKVKLCARCNTKDELTGKSWKLRLYDGRLLCANCREVLFGD